MNNYQDEFTNMQEAYENNVEQPFSGSEFVGGAPQACFAAPPVGSNTAMADEQQRNVEALVTFNTLGGSLPPGTHNPRWVWPGTAIGTLPIPIRSQHQFRGWWSGNTQIHANTTIWHNMTINASWFFMSGWGRAIRVGNHYYAFPVLGAIPAPSYGVSHGGRDAIDIFMPEGTPVVAIIAGTLTQVRNSHTPQGRAPRADIILRGDDGINYYYTHLRVNSPAAFGFQNGNAVRVDAGQPIGRIGNRAESDNTDPHLHISATPVVGANGPIDEHHGDWLRRLFPQLR